MAEPAEIGKCAVCRRRVAPALPWSTLFQRISGRYGSSEISVIISASVHARTVRVRTLPREPVIMANLATASPFGASMMSKKSDSPEVRNPCLISIPSFLARFA